MDTLLGGQAGERDAEEEGPRERPPEEANRTQTVVKSEKDEAQAALGLGLRGGDGGESNSPSKQAMKMLCYRLSRRFDDALRPPIGGLP